VRLGIVTGVRTGDTPHDLRFVGETDVMRGEETLCIGLLTLGVLGRSSIVLNLGSHWKVILLNPNGDIASSITSMSGELLHVAQTQTILADAVPCGRPELIDEGWLGAGMSEQRRSGLARALFCVRLLEQEGENTSEERLSFMLGAFIASELDALLKQGVFEKGLSVVITGGGAVATAWRRALADASIESTVVSEARAEEALLRGLIEIVSCSSNFVRT
jgi:2-dehydro-3-deoxygalactonokinase